MQGNIAVTGRAHCQCQVAFLFFLSGIAGIVFSCNTQDAKRRGDVPAARQASNTAKTLLIVAIVVGIILWVLNIIIRSATDVWYWNA